MAREGCIVRRAKEEEEIKLEIKVMKEGMTVCREVRDEQKEREGRDEVIGKERVEMQKGG